MDKKGRALPLTQAGAFMQIKADSGSRLSECLLLLKTPGQNSRPGRVKVNNVGKKNYLRTLRKKHYKIEKYCLLDVFLTAFKK